MPEQLAGRCKGEAQLVARNWSLNQQTQGATKRPETIIFLLHMRRLDDIFTAGNAVIMPFFRENSGWPVFDWRSFFTVLWPISASIASVCAERFFGLSVVRLFGFSVASYYVFDSNIIPSSRGCLKNLDNVRTNILLFFIYEFSDYLFHVEKSMIYDEI